MKLRALIPSISSFFYNDSFGLYFKTKIFEIIYILNFKHLTHTIDFLIRLAVDVVQTREIGEFEAAYCCR